jgi:AcrR family transcriptional regulator
VTTGLRERKKAATRSALHEAALRLVAERGLDGVSVDDIAARADVSPRTFFNYFDTKDDAVFDWDHRLTCQLVEALEERPAAEAPLTALRCAIAGTLPGLVEDPDWHRRGAVLRANPDLVPKLMHNNRRMEDAVAGAVAVRTGDTADDLRPRLIAGCGLVALRGALRGWDPAGDAAELLALLDEAFAELAAGLPGREPAG